MSKHTAEHESTTLYSNAEAIKHQYGQLAIQRLEIDSEMARLAEQLGNIEHTLGTLNPGKRVGWGEVG